MVLFPGPRHTGALVRSFVETATYRKGKHPLQEQASACCRSRVRRHACGRTRASVMHICMHVLTPTQGVREMMVLKEVNKTSVTAMRFTSIIQLIRSSSAQSKLTNSYQWLGFQKASATLLQELVVEAFLDAQQRRGFDVQEHATKLQRAFRRLMRRRQKQSNAAIPWPPPLSPPPTMQVADVNVGAAATAVVSPLPPPPVLASVRVVPPPSVSEGLTSAGELPNTANVRALFEVCQVDVSTTVIMSKPASNGSTASLGAPAAAAQSLESFLDSRGVRTIIDLQSLATQDRDVLLHGLEASPDARQRILQLTVTKDVPPDAPDIISYI